jgi:hypothetical protein
VNSKGTNKQLNVIKKKMEDMKGEANKERGIQ